MHQNCFEDIVGEEEESIRLDIYLAERIEDASRSFIQKLIKDKRVVVNGSVCARPSRMVVPGDSLSVDLPPPPSTEMMPEDIPLEILFEDSDVMVVNKPSGLVVHPAPGHDRGTLVNAILYHCPYFTRPGSDASRPGIVHRLDRFTSGVLVVAKNEAAFGSLSRQAREHTFDRRYLALVRGDFKEDRGLINATVGRSLADPKRMSVTGIRGREAVTHFHVVERFGVASLVALQLETGRTHQIRVHLRFAGHPVLGDPVYGVTSFASWQVGEGVKTVLERLEGQALHAEHLGFEHPSTGERMSFTAPPPTDFAAALEALRAIAPRPV